MNSSFSPNFYELEEYPFQRFCCDLFRAQENIASCDEYGLRGQAQKGIDLLAQRRDESGQEVGQCKCYREFPHGKILV
jgi:hypothetical protein